ncbi:hypothetical protein ACFXPN_29620 [Streptomyces griseorubiginosus]|uniref:hypothetical protein n=1 Tax=Streptomyces griseorubiginosus TaxID=67304 RepID=UPI0036C5016C
MNTRTDHAPTPRDIAARCGTPVPGGTCTAPAETAPMRPTPYDRHEWEDAVLHFAFPSSVRYVALMLAHYAGPAGHLPAGGMQHTGRMSERTGLGPERVRNSMRLLERAGFLWRPARDPLNGSRVRPITLTMPPARARGELPNTGEVPA